MKLQFDANQTFQLDAINAAVDLFKGQPAGVEKGRKSRFWPENGVFPVYSVAKSADSVAK